MVMRASRASNIALRTRGTAHLRECEAGMGLPGEWDAPQREWLMILPLILPLSQIFPKVLSGQDSLPSFSLRICAGHISIRRFRLRCAADLGIRSNRDIYILW